MFSNFFWSNLPLGSKKLKRQALLVKTDKSWCNELIFSPQHIRCKFTPFMFYADTYLYGIYYLHKVLSLSV